MFKNTSLKILSFVLIAILLLLNVQGIARADDKPKDLFKNYVNIEQKILCEATLEENFADNVVLVLLNREASTILDISRASVALKTYGPSDFAEINCIEVQEISFIRNQIDEELSAIKPSDISKFDDTVTAADLGIDVQQFNRYLLLRLEYNSKENVLEAIRELEKREDVQWAGPNYFGSISATNP